MNDVTSDDEIFIGRTVEATYRVPAVPSHRGNPLIEALPPILEDEGEITIALSNRVRFDKEFLEASPRLRLYEVDRLRQFWMPDREHVALEAQISMMLRSGYRNRNPADVGKWYELMAAAKQRMETPLEAGFPGGLPQAREIVQAHATGMAIEGVSGVGKTTSVKRILSLYPQVIVHSDERRRIPTAKQIVWLMITCPGDGGAVGLTRAIIRAFDAVLGENHLDGYMKKRASAETMRAAAVSRAHLHALGVLVIDEIQILNRSKSDNVEGIKNFLLVLMNELQVPVVVIGSTGTATFLASDMQTGRRFSGGGYFRMERLTKGEELELFVRRIWGSSLLREHPKWSELPEDSRKAIVEAVWLMTAGVHDLVVKAFVLAQNHALSRGQEALTPQIFQAVYERDFRPLHANLKGLRGGDVVDEAEWDRVRRAFFAGDTSDSSAASDPAVSAAFGTVRRDAASPAKRVRKRKPSPPHRKAAEDPEAEIQARTAALRAEGLLGRPVTGLGGDFDVG